MIIGTNTLGSVSAANANRLDGISTTLTAIQANDAREKSRWGVFWSELGPFKVIVVKPIQSVIASAIVLATAAGALALMRLYFGTAVASFVKWLQQFIAFLSG